MITNLFIFYFTVFIAFQWGQRIAMTTMNTKTFFIIILTIWTLIKNIA
jgi:hypothetical protein